MRSSIPFAVLAFAIFSSNSLAALPDSCVGNFCMFKPLTERQFVARYGEGLLRRDNDDKELHYRCFYDGITKQWAEFEFSRHGDREPRHLQGVTLGQTEMCSSHYRSRRPMNLKIAKGSITIGMGAKEVAAKLGPPSTIASLSPHEENPIYDSQFGDQAWIYQSAESLLLTAVYFKDGKMVNYRLLNSE